MTYTELVAAIEAYTENYEQLFVDNIPVFVKQAEKRIYNTAQIPALRKNVTGATKASNKYLPCPVDFLSTYSVAVVDSDGNYEYLLNKDVNFIRAAYPSPSDTGLPKYYAIFGPAVASETVSDELTFIMGPTPDAAYTFVYDRLTRIEDADTFTNTVEVPFRFYPCLAAGLAYYLAMKKAPDRVQILKAVYEEEFNRAAYEDVDRANISLTPRRDFYGFG